MKSDSALLNRNLQECLEFCIGSSRNGSVIDPIIPPISICDLEGGKRRMEINELFIDDVGILEHLLQSRN
jgi:hypothetical protein